MLVRKCVLKICSKFTGEHPCLSVISIKLQSNLYLRTPLEGCFYTELISKDYMEFTIKQNTENEKLAENVDLYKTDMNRIMATHE